MLFLEVSLLAFLLQGNIASDPEALTRTFGISGLIVGLDISLKVFLWFTVTCLMIVLIMFKMWSPQNKNENFSFQQAHLVVNLVSIFLLVNMNVLHFHLLFQKKKRLWIPLFIGWTILPVCRLYIFLDLGSHYSLITVKVAIMWSGICGLSTSCCSLLSMAPYCSCTIPGGEKDCQVSYYLGSAHHLFLFLIANF